MKMTRRKEAVQEGTLGSLQKLWSRYRNYWNSLATQKIVAVPATAFPAGNPKLLSDAAVGHRRVKTDANGNTAVVTQKLIIPVPLHVTDEEATKLIFEQLKTDFNTVQTWLRDHLGSFFNDYEEGCKLATEVQELPAPNELQQAVAKSKASESAFALAIKYFKEEHGGYTDSPAFQPLSIQTLLHETASQRNALHATWEYLAGRRPWRLWPFWHRRMVAFQSLHWPRRRCSMAQGSESMLLKLMLA